MCAHIYIYTLVFIWKELIGNNSYRIMESFKIELERDSPAMFYHLLKKNKHLTETRVRDKIKIKYSNKYFGRTVISSIYRRTSQ